MIQFFAENTAIPTLPSRSEEWLEKIITSEKKKLGEVSFIFCDDEHLLHINKTYLDHDYYTDIITFDYVKGKIISGDIFISLQRVNENAAIQKVSPLNELQRVLAHGVLHLCGYKDKNLNEQAIMRTLEEKYLNLFSEFFS